VLSLLTQTDNQSPLVQISTVIHAGLARATQ
jgi:hypothetical protein